MYCIHEVCCHSHFCRALSAGCSAPLLVCPSHESYPLSARVTALGALHAAYVVCYMLQCYFLWLKHWHDVIASGQIFSTYKCSKNFEKKLKFMVKFIVIFLSCWFTFILIFPIFVAEFSSYSVAIMHVLYLMFTLTKPLSVAFVSSPFPWMCIHTHMHLFYGDYTNQPV